MMNLEKSKHHTAMFQVDSKSDMEEYSKICDMVTSGKALITHNEKVKLTDESGDPEGGYTKIDKIYIVLEWKTFKTPKPSSKPPMPQPDEVDNNPHNISPSAL